MNAIKNAVNYAVDNSFISTANDGKDLYFVYI